MSTLSEFKHLDIDWDMTPEEAVTLYLEWGNNSWRGRRPPVTSKSDYSNYFVVNTWEPQPTLLLIRRNSEGSSELASMELPDDLKGEFLLEVGDLKGVWAPSERIKSWLKGQIYN